MTLLGNSSNLGLIAYADVNLDGTIIESSDITVERTAVGRYTLTLPENLGQSRTYPSITHKISSDVGAIPAFIMYFEESGTVKKLACLNRVGDDMTFPSAS